MTLKESPRTGSRCDIKGRPHIYDGHKWVIYPDPDLDKRLSSIFKFDKGVIYYKILKNTDINFYYDDESNNIMFTLKEEGALKFISDIKQKHKIERWNEGDMIDLESANISINEPIYLEYVKCSRCGVKPVGSWDREDNKKPELREYNVQLKDMICPGCGNEYPGCWEWRSK